MDPPKVSIISLDHDLPPLKPEHGERKDYWHISGAQGMCHQRVIRKQGERREKEARRAENCHYVMIYENPKN